MNWRHGIRSLFASWKLLLFILISLLLLCLTSLQGYIVSRQSTRTIEDQYARLIAENMDSVSVNLSNYLNYIDDFARTLSNHPALIESLQSGAKPQTERQLSAFAEYYHLRLPVNIQVFDSRQRVYAYPAVNTEEEQRLLRTVSDFPWFENRVAIDNNFLHWNVSSDYHIASHAEAALYVSKNMIQNNRSLGLLVIELNGTLIERMLDRAQINADNPIFLFSGDEETMLFHSERLTGDISDWSAHLLAIYRTIKDARADEGALDIRLSGRPYRLLYMQVASTPWTMASLLPPSALHASSVSTWRITALTTGVSILFIAVFFAVLHRKVTMPIRRLSRIVEDSNGKGMLPDNYRYSGFKEIETLNSGIHRFLGKIQEQVETIRRGETEKRMLELQRLQEQMRPHFWHNSLNALRFMAMLRGDPTMAEALLSLTRMLDYTLRNTDVLYSTLEEEIEYAMSFVKFQEIRAMRTYRVELDVDAAALRAEIPKFTVQPLVENAIVHGFAAPFEGETLLRIEARARGGDLALTVADNGKGIAPAALLGPAGSGRRSGRGAPGGLSLANLRQRLRLEYGSPYGLEIDSAPGAYTKVKLSLPYRPAEQKMEGMPS
ncbi:sensor histidine kinase [Cohnella hashimotonis]|uniref:Histidine kinase n=1 Tax=Cohnella hashimotonis TaxID=2826895 RepID=A0ABT6TTK7_9BACL|nr:histidine kinase [Cohnella hashimotonis]MDI4650197.1 histidine kinase [Cohnella hashimotonis]